MLLFSPQAERDIEIIALYIAEDNPLAAQRWHEDLHAHCVRIGDAPHIGVAHFEIRAGLRMLPAGNYLILYRAIEDGAEIVRVIHGARQWQEML